MKSYQTVENKQLSLTSEDGVSVIAHLHPRIVHDGAVYGEASVEVSFERCHTSIQCSGVHGWVIRGHHVGHTVLLHLLKLRVLCRQLVRLRLHRVRLHRVRLHLVRLQGLRLISVERRDGLGGYLIEVRYLLGRVPVVPVSSHTRVI